MWEQVRSNRRKTLVLVAGMALLLFGLGYVIGEAAQPGLGILGLAAAFAVWTVMSLVAYFQGDRILLRASGARPIEKQDHPTLFNVVEEMKIASGFQYMPKIYIIDDMSLNAFAMGRKPENAAVAVTAGLLAKLDRDELQGVVGHEMAHVVNRDVLLMSMVGVMLGAIVMVSEIYLRSMFYGSMHGSRRYRSSSRRGGGGGGPMVVVAIVLAVLTPIFAQLIYLAISRKREYLADASAAVYTRYPAGLASALEKLGAHNTPLQRANRATASMYIVNPFSKAKLAALTSTHPPTQERIDILQRMGGRVSYAQYQQAWAGVGGKKAGHLPKSALERDQAQAARKASADADSARKRTREAGDLLRNLNQFLFLPCPCGLRLKLPPEYKKDSIACPKCSRVLVVPIAEIAAVKEVAEHLPGMKPEAPQEKQARRSGKKAAGAEPLRVKRRAGEWMSFKCRCGATKTLSPGFKGNRSRCAKCGRSIEVVG